MQQPTIWSIQRVRAYGLDGVGSLNPISSYFDSKADEAKAKASVDKAKITADAQRAKVRTRSTAAVAKSSQWKRWIPLIVTGAVISVGIVALAASGRKRKR